MPLALRTTSQRQTPILTPPRAHLPRTDQEIAEAFYAWNPRKAQFTSEQIEIAAGRLRAGGWVDDEDT